MERGEVRRVWEMWEMWENVGESRLWEVGVVVEGLIDGAAVDAEEGVVVDGVVGAAAPPPPPPP